MDLIARYASDLARSDRSERTVTDYTTVLRRIDRQLKYGLVGACTDELYEWIWAPGHGPATRGLYRSIIGGFFGWATAGDRPWIDYDPARNLPRPRRPRGLPKPVRTEVLTAILANSREPHRVRFLLAAYAGLRCVEIAGLDRAHVTEEHVRVRKGKGGKERYVPTHPVLWRAVAELPRGPVAVDHDGVTRLTASQVVHRGNHHLRHVLGVDASMHKLRHWFGTEAYRASRDVMAVRDLMGHSDVATTQVYVQVADGQREKAVAALPDLT